MSSYGRNGKDRPLGLSLPATSSLVGPPLLIYGGAQPKVTNTSTAVYRGGTKNYVAPRGRSLRSNGEYLTLRYHGT